MERMTCLYKLSCPSNNPRDGAGVVDEDILIVEVRVAEEEEAVAGERGGNRHAGEA